MFTKDITIAYLSPDEPFARVLIETLIACGLTVGQYQIDSSDYEGLLEGEKVAVVWSHKSANYRNTRASADMAHERNALIIVQTDDCLVPERFAGASTVAMLNWNGGRYSPGMRALLSLWPDRFQPTKLGLNKSRSGYRLLEVPDSVSVFIAHATPDKPRIRPLVVELLECGFSVWIDKPQDLGLDPHYYERMKNNRIFASEDWRAAITKAISTRDWVLAVWSHLATSEPRPHFHYELYQGLRQDKLVPCCIDKVDPGPPYNFLHAVDLSGFNPTQNSASLQQVMDKLASIT